MKKLTVLLILAAMVLCVSEGFAGTGKAGWWILRRPQSTKPRTMTSLASIRGDLSGVFYNPSILATIQSKEVFFMSESGLAADTFASVLYGHPLKEGSGLSGGIVYYDAGKTTLNYVENGVLQTANVTIQQDILGIVSYGRTINQDMIAGATLKFASSALAEYKTSSAFALDIGAIYYYPKMEGLMLTAVAQNIGSSSAFLNQADELPMSVAIGASYGWQLGKNYLGAGIDVPYILADSRVTPSIGLDYSLGKLSFNFGYNMGKDDSNIHLGANFMEEKYDVGIAVSPSSYLASAVRVSVGYRF